jgi:hypothetical protein
MVPITSSYLPITDELDGVVVIVYHNPIDYTRTKHYSNSRIAEIY